MALSDSDSDSEAWLIESEDEQKALRDSQGGRYYKDKRPSSIKCNQCGKTFNTESGWTKHMKISHRKISNKEIINLECVSCQKKFNSRNNI